MNRRILLFFFYALFLALTLPSLMPNVHLIYFAPFLILTYYNKSKFFSMWMSFLCGFLIDLLAFKTRLGIYPLSYCLSTWILYPQKQHFFEDSLSTLPIMTFLFSILSTLIQIVLNNLFGQQISFSLDLVFHDLIGMPLLDAFYAGIAFTILALFIPKATKRRSLVFSPKKGGFS